MFMFKILVWVLMVELTPYVRCRPQKKKCKKLKFAERINQDNHEVNSLVGVDFKFDCRVIGMPEPNITWTKDDMPLKDVSYRSFGPRGLEKVFVLILKNLLVADSGRYKCTADNGECKAISTSLKLNIKENSPREIPRVKYLRPHNPTIEVGQNIIFTCVVEKVGDFTPNIKWIKYRTYKLQPTIPPTLHSKNTSLSTTSGLSTTTTTTMKSTAEAPNDDKEHSTTLNVDRIAETKYTVDGIVHEKTEIKVERAHKSELIISSSSLSDSAEYTCMTFNEIGYDQMQSNLNVRPKPPLSLQELEHNYIRRYGGEPHKLPFSLAAIVVIPVCLLIIIIIGCVWWHSNEERLGDERTKMEKEKGVDTTAIEERKTGNEMHPIVSLQSTTSDSYSNDEKSKLIYVKNIDA